MIGIPTASIFRLGSLATSTQIINATAVVIACVYAIVAYRSWQTKGPDRPDADLDRAVTAVGMFITVGVAGASVLATGTGVVLGVGGGKKPLPAAVTTELTLAMGALVLSLVFGVISASYVLTQLHQRTSVAESAPVIVCATIQMLSMAFGGLAFMLSLVLL